MISGSEYHAEPLSDDLEQVLQIIKLILQDAQLILVNFTDVLGDLPLALHGLLHMGVLSLRATRVGPLATSQTYPAGGGHDLNRKYYLLSPPHPPPSPWYL